MSNRLLSAFALSMLSITAFTQQLSIYNPQELYENPGGLFDADMVRSMFVDFEDPDYHATLVNAFFENPDLRIPATVTIDEMAIDSVGARYKGNSTFCLPNDEGNVKVPYNMDFNYWNEDGELLGFHKVKLANAWLDPTFAKEYLAAAIYQRYLPSPEVSLVALHTQGNYTGVYANTESINKQFLNKHFDENDGALFKCDGSGVFCGENEPNIGYPTMHWLGTDSTDYYNSYDLKSEHGWGELMNLIYTLNFNPAEIEDVLNIDRVLWAFAVNQTILNLDTYNGYYVHNYYMYLSENGLWQMIPWDLDNSFGGALLGLDYFNPNVLFHFNPYDGETEAEQKPLAHLLLSNPLYRKQYNAHLRTIMEESLDEVAILSDANEIQELAHDAVDADPNKLFPMNLFTENVTSSIFTGWGFAGITSTVEIRRAFLESAECPEINVNAPAISNVELSNWSSDATGTYITVQATVDGATEVDLMATTSEYNSHFEDYEMNDLGNGIYETSLYFNLNNPIEWKFYIRAQTPNAMTLSPQRAEYEFYHFTTPVGLEEIANEFSMDLIPNPTSSKFSFRGLPNAERITVYSMNGEMVHQQNGLVDVQVDEWAPGVYLVEAQTSGSILRERIVVCD